MPKVADFAITALATTAEHVCGIVATWQARRWQAGACTLTLAHFRHFSSL